MNPDAQFFEDFCAAFQIDAFEIRLAVGQGQTKPISKGSFHSVTKRFRSDGQEHWSAWQFHTTQMTALTNVEGLYSRVQYLIEEASTNYGLSPKPPLEGAGLYGYGIGARIIFLVQYNPSDSHKIEWVEISIWD